MDLPSPRSNPGKVGFPPIPSEGCFCLASPKPLEHFSFPSLIHLVPCTSAPHGDVPGSSCGGWAGRKVTSGAQGVGGEARIGVSGRREQAGTCHLSKLIPRATLKSRPSCPARFSPFFPHSFAWDDTALACPCFCVWDSRLVEPIHGR